MERINYFKMTEVEKKKFLESMTPEERRQFKIDRMNGLYGESEEINKNLKGFGGWLILFAIGSIISSAYCLYYLLTSTIPFIISDDYIVFVSEFPFIGLLLVFEIIYNIAIPLIVIICFYLIVKEKKLFKKMAISFLLLDNFFILIIYFLYLSNPNTIGLSSEILINFFKSIFTSLIWIPYFLLSKRVKNTYVK